MKVDKTTVPSAEVVMERLKMALAEAGYPNEDMWYEGESRPDGWPLIWFMNEAPLRVWHRAAMLVYEGRVSCVDCWQTEHCYECQAGRCGQLVAS